VRGGGGLAGRVGAVLPGGTVPVGGGLGVLGAGFAAQLAIAGHTLSTAGMAAMSVLWTLVFWAGLGVFLPVEQELTRLVAARRVTGEGITPVVARGMVLAGGVLLLTLTGVAAAAGPVTTRLFGGDAAMTAALAAALTALAVTAVSRGVLAGLGHFGAYGGQLATDGGLRIVAACVLGAAGVRSPAAFGLTLAGPSLVSAAVTLGPVLRGLGPGPAVTWRALCRGLGLLIATMLVAQLVVNVAVISVRLLDPGDPAVTGALLAAMVVARLPLFAFTSLQVSLLPGLSGSAAAGDLSRFRQLIARGCAIVTVLGIGAGLPAVLLGPWLIRVVFAARPVLGHADFAWLAAGTLCYLIALVLGQSALALARHRDLLAAWLAGAVVLAAVTLGPGAVSRRVVIAYAVSSLTVAATLALVLFLRAGRAGRARRGGRAAVRSSRRAAAT
jgi:O-antigen/teichoic acid export membrane protein